MPDDHNSADSTTVRAELIRLVIVLLLVAIVLVLGILHYIAAVI